ncbi:MAG: hypothetical protein R6U66_08355 [Bacteroidales bacterium]
MKSVFLFFVFSMLVVLGGAQEVDKVHQLHQLHQLSDGHNQMLKSFKDLGVTAEYVYVVFYPPMSCPRCEGVIKPFLQQVSKLDSSGQTAVVAFYKKQKAAIHFLEKQEFDAVFHLVDTESELLDGFYLSSNTLQVPFLLKFNARTGHLLSSISTLGINYNEELVKEMVGQKSPLPKFTRVENTDVHSVMKITKLPKSVVNLVLKPAAIYRIQENENQPLGVVSTPGFTEDFKRLAFVGDLTHEVHLLERKEDKYVVKQIFKPGTEEEMLFKHKDVSDSIFYLLRQYGVLHSMYFNPTIIDDCLLINASLPNLFWEDKENEEVGYKNQASFLFKDITSGHLVNYYSLKGEYAKGDLIFNHTSAVFDWQRTQFLLPIEKGWPVVGTTSSPDTMRYLNLNSPEFYKNAPMFSLFDTTGKLIRLVGSLPKFHQKLHLGYSFFHPRLKVSEAAIWLSDAYSGQLTKYEGDDYRKTIVFPGFRYTDSLFEDIPHIATLDDLFKIKKKLTKKVVDFYVSDEDILLLIKEGEFLYLTKLVNGRESELRNYLTTRYNGLRLSSFQFVESQEKPTICAIGENSDEAHVVVFDIPN